MIINPVPMNEVGAWREEAIPMLRRCDRWLGGRMRAEHLLEACEQDRMLLWSVHDFDENLVAVIVTQVTDYPMARILSFVACAGRDMRAWMKPAMIAIRDYAKKKECTTWEIWARKGWRRVIAKFSPVRELLVVLEGDV